MPLPSDKGVIKVRYGLVLLAFVAAIYYITRVANPGGFWGSYVLPASLWAVLSLIILFFFPVVRANSIPRHRKLFYWVALICGVAGVAAFLAGGLMVGFGKTPYAQDPRGILINLFYLGFMLVGIEVSRAWLVNGLFSKKPGLGIPLTAFIFTFFSFPLSRIRIYETALEGVEFLGGTFLPSFMEHLLASYLVFLAGPLPAVIYRGSLMGFEWFFPYLPDLNWTAKAMLGTFAPVFGMALAYTFSQSEVLRKRAREKEGLGSWVAVSAVAVLLIWFVVGGFSYYPNVIISGSMRPHIDVGDIVIVQRIHPSEVAEKVQVGDVIQFQENEIRITHRVIEVVEDENGLLVYITQGDNNRIPDSDPVLPEQVLGTVNTVVPKLGWITIWVRQPG